MKNEVKEEWAARTLRLPKIGSRIWLVARGDALWGAELEPRFEMLAARLETAGLELAPGARRDARRPILAAAAEALEAYFAGDAGALSEVKLATLPGSPFQRKVWRRVHRIPPGRTLTYPELAVAVRMTGAFRAIGAANASNPVVLFVPCHRVVSTTGRLQGYGAGLDVKSKLLLLEGVPNDGTRLQGV